MHLIIIAMRSHLCYLNITSAITANTPQAVLSAVIINFFIHSPNRQRVCFLTNDCQSAKSRQIQTKSRFGDWL